MIEKYENRMMQSPMDRENDAFADLGPTAPARGSVYSMARKVREEVQIAMELAIDGPRCDVPRAMQHLDRARSILGAE